MAHRWCSRRLVRNLVLLPPLLAPAAVVLELDGLPRGLSTALALAWLFPVSQLIYAEYTAFRFENFARDRLRTAAPVEEALYGEELMEASAARFTRRVLGTFGVPLEEGFDDTLICASVPNQFPLQVGSRVGTPRMLSPGTRRIGTAETPFLAPLPYIHLFALEFFRRLDPTLDGPTLAGDDLPLRVEDEALGPAAGDRPELHELDAGLRRVGEWLRNRLDDDPGVAHDAVHALSLFYYTNQAERLRQLLARGRTGEPPTARDAARFWAIMRRIGVRRPVQLGESRPPADQGGSIREGDYTRRVREFARRYSIDAVHPLCIDLASFLPRLILVILLAAVLHGGQALSPVDLLLAHLRQGGATVGAGAMLLVVGLVGAALSYRSYSIEWVMRPMPWALRRLRRGRGRTAVLAMLAAGPVGCAALAPGLMRGEPDLVGLALPGLLGGLLALEFITVRAARTSLLAVLRHYHYRPAVAVGGFRLVGFHVLHYLLFLGLASWIGKSVAPFLEGRLVEIFDRQSWQRQFRLLEEDLPWLAVMAMAGAATVAVVGRHRGWSPVRSVKLLAVIAAMVLLVVHRPIGGFVAGGTIVLAALYLAHHALFLLAVGSTALVRALGSPLRLAALTVPAAILGLVSGSLQGWLGIELGPAAELLGGEAFREVWAALSWTLLVLVAVGLGDPALAAPTTLAALGASVQAPWWGAGLCQSAFGVTAAAAIVVRLTRGLRLRRGREQDEARPEPPGPGASLADELSNSDRIAVLVTGTNPVASLALLMRSSRRATDSLMSVWDGVIAPNTFPSAAELLDDDGSPLTRARVQQALRWTFHQERRRRCSLFGPEAIVVAGRRTAVQQALEDEAGPFHLTCSVKNEDEAATLRLGLRLIRYLTTRAPSSIAPRDDRVGWAISQRDTATYLVQLAVALKEAELNDRVTFYLQSNKQTNRRLDTVGERNPADPGALFLMDPRSARRVEYRERLALSAYLRVVAGVDCEVTHTHSFDACKSAAQNGHSGSLNLARWAYLLDRNSQCFTIGELIHDIRRFTRSSEAVAMLPPRSTPNLAYPIGSQADLSEYGFSVFAEALVADLGGDRGELIGTGHGNLVRLPGRELTRALANPRLPYRFDPRQDGPARWFGAIYGMTNSPHVSEDYVQVITSSEQLKGMGKVPRLEVGRALHYKLREHTSILEVGNCRLRWSGGGDCGQKGRDPFLQRLCEFGTDSVFAREMRRNRGRYYTLIPLAILTILAASTLVLTGYTPFTGISVLFWIGLACNQALTLNGLASYVRRAGPWGGAAIWISQRFRDILLFPPLAFIEMKGVFDALRKGDRFGFVFHVSGQSRARDDTPLVEAVTADPASYGMVACMVATGLAGTGLNLVAINRLDLSSVIMLYPSLMFIEGLVLGGLVYWGLRGPGRSVLGVVRWAPKVLGCGIGLLTVASFALGVGAAREVSWIDLPGGEYLSRTLSGVPPHVALLALASGLGFLMLPGRSALAPVEHGPNELSPPHQAVRRLRHWHNVGVLVVWIIAVAVAAWFGILSEGMNLDGLAAAVMLSAVGLVKLIAVYRGPRGGRQVRSRGAWSYVKETLRRSAIITVGATMWFALAPVPAQFSFQFLDYSVTFRAAQLARMLVVAVEVVTLVIVAGFIANMVAWRTLRAYHRRLHQEYERRLNQGPAPLAIAAVVEAALEGYRVARDSHAPTTAAGLLRSVDRALDHWSAAVPLFDSRPPSRRPVDRWLSGLRLLCEG